MKQIPELSDWIQFLISQKNHCNSWLIGCVSALIVLFSLIMLIIFYLGTFLGILVNIPIFFLYIQIAYSAFQLRPVLKKSKKLLADIMNEQITEVNKIKEIWFNEEENNMDNLRFVSYFSMALGLGFVIFAVLVMNVQLGNAGMSLFMLGLALLAISFTKDSDKRLTKLGNESNQKLTIIANAVFMEIVDIFQDKRLQLWQFIDKDKYNDIDETRRLIETVCWKAATYSYRALKLVESTNIDEKNQTKFFNVLKTFINNSGLPWDGIKKKNKNKKEQTKVILLISEKDAGNILKICNDVLEFNLNDEQEKKVKELIVGINNYIKFLKKVPKK